MNRMLGIVAGFALGALVALPAVAQDTYTIGLTGAQVSSTGPGILQTSTGNIDVAPNSSKEGRDCFVKTNPTINPVKLIKGKDL